MDSLQRLPEECEVETCSADLRDDESAQTVCLEMTDGACGGCDDVAVLDAAETQLSGHCGFVEARRVECGPGVSDTGFCCYTVALVQNLDGCDQTTAGRPLIVEDAQRTAEVGPANGWPRSVSPKLEGLTARDREALATAWMRDALAEHASIAAFARHLLELLALGAPPDLLAAIQRAADDEIEHARLCFGFARAYGGIEAGPGPLSLRGVEIQSCDRGEVAVRLVAEGCVGETLAAAEAAIASNACEDPVVAAVLRRIAEDESRHAALAWRTLAWLLKHADISTHHAVQPAFDTAFERANMAKTFESDDHLRSRGRLGEPERRKIAQQTFIQVIMPATRALLLRRDAMSPVFPA